ncbi:MAG: hypothetical protein ACRDTQ_20415 [Micromonosporaceae bacterium]
MFHYRAVYLRDETEQPIGLIVEKTSQGSLQAVIWDRRKEQWTFAPEVAAPIIFDPRNRRRWKLIDRKEAQQIAKALGTTLPTEAKLQQLCED